MTTNSTLPAANAAESRNGFVAPRWAWLTATFFGMGHLRPAPGTWGALGAVGVWAAVAGFVPATWRTPAALGLTALICVLGIPASTLVARATGDEDPSFVVIDEVAGQMLAFVAVPFHWSSLLAAFLFFRAFDIIKPPPLRHLERLPGGVGIMLDDIGAGVYAWVGMQLLLHFAILK